MRWAISTVIGNGAFPIVEGQEETTGPYRAAASQYGSCTVVIPGNEDGTPKFGWCIVRFEDDVDAVAASADTRVRLFPQWDLDHVITAQQAAAIAAALDDFGIAGYPDPTGRTVRQVVRWTADRLDVTWQVR